MASEILTNLVDEVQQTRGVVQSAIALINGIAQRITDAVAAATVNGATAEELAPLTELESSLEVDRTDLARAVQANS